MEKIAQAFNCNMFILPSSIQETILVPFTLAVEMDIKQLKDMVAQINRDQVLPEEVLTDQVYIYDKKAKALLIADDWLDSNANN